MVRYFPKKQTLANKMSWRLPFTIALPVIISVRLADVRLEPFGVEERKLIYYLLNFPVSVSRQAKTKTGNGMENGKRRLVRLVC